MESSSFVERSEPTISKRTERLILLLTFTIVFLVRFQFRQISLWEWDETLFASAIHRFNLWEHSPHPPGYILWVAIIRLFYKFFANESSAQVFASVLFGSLTIFPLYYIFRFVAPFSLAFGSTLLYVFNPAVWVEGESGFSDTTGVFWFFLALAVLLRARQNRYWYLGCFLLGVALGVRTANLPLGAFVLIPFGWKLRARDFRAAFMGVGIVGLTCLAWLIPTVVYGAGGLKSYIRLLSDYGQDTAAQDKWSLNLQWIMYRARWYLKEMLLTIWGSRYVAVLFNLLALVGLFAYIKQKKWWALLVLLACFLPYFIFTFLIHALHHIRYCIPYIPFFCFFIAVGVYECASKLGRLRDAAFGVGLVLILLFFATQALPAVRVLHGEKSPILQAIEYIQNHLSLEKTAIYYDHQLYSFMRLYLKDYKTKFPNNRIRGQAYPPPSGTDAYVLSVLYPARGSTRPLNFKQTSPALRLQGLKYLWHYDVWLSQADIVYVDFQSQEEHPFLWMADRGVCYLRNHDGSSILSIKAHVPVSLFEQPPLITIYLNDQVLDTFYGNTATILKVFSIPGENLEANGWSKLEIAVDQTVDLAASPYAGKAEGRLGLILESLTWDEAGMNVEVPTQGNERIIIGR